MPVRYEEYKGKPLIVLSRDEDDPYPFKIGVGKAKRNCIVNRGDRRRTRSGKKRAVRGVPEQVGSERRPARHLEARRSDRRREAVFAKPRKAFGEQKCQRDIGAADDAAKDRAGVSPDAAGIGCHDACIDREREEFGHKSGSSPR